MGRAAAIRPRPRPDRRWPAPLPRCASSRLFLSPHVGLAVADSDVAEALLGAQLDGIVLGHEVEHAGGARGIQNGRGAATVLHRRLHLAWFGLAGMMKHLAG